MGELVRIFAPSLLKLELIDDDRADYMKGTRLTFKSQEDAIHFAKKQGKGRLHVRSLRAADRLFAGWDYYV